MALEIPSGIGILFRPLLILYKWLKNKMFLPTLTASHRGWAKRDGFGARWIDIGEDIQFSLGLARSPEGPKESRIMLRSPKKKFERVTVVIEAYSNKLLFQESKVVHGIDERMLVVTLPGIPAFEYFIRDDGNIGISYESFMIRVISITEDGITRHVNWRSHNYAPVNQIMANPDNWEWWEGKLFNVELIRYQQEALQSRLWEKLGCPFFMDGRVYYRGTGFIKYLISSVVLRESFVRTL